ncbi:hypothetical protein [Pseudomonas nunensis]|uniref:Uncharacterized protein n=1 Tax=Pseudomonas nunensis TaxID=2961896 RepID=A0ABY5EC40_9PSED|nr:hypothetical protein [Pseudomonas nunensis]MCL5229488.1 hypothetical protein [Pseudomonas nunensis]UTO12013.1 hypothetical protein NK667_17715 [Pseudomonas nunensis]
MKSGSAVYLDDLVLRVYDGFAAERSLAGSAAATGRWLAMTPLMQIKMPQRRTP